MITQQKIAVVGGGISGLTCAWYLSKQHQVTVFEANSVLGGHTDTHQIQTDDKTIAVDSGFIVFNQDNYTGFTQLLSELNVASELSEMSFSVTNERTGFEYGAGGLGRLLARKSNIINPHFYRMLMDIARFYRQAPAVLDIVESSPTALQTLGDYLKQHNYSQVFTENHILPMASALWSADVSVIMSFPVRYFVAFMSNHKMLNLGQRPEWRVVSGGSSTYVKALQANCKATFRCNQAVQSITRDQQGVDVHSLCTVSNITTTERFDKVIMACHSDQTLKCLATPTENEQRILGAIQYQANHVLLHTDETVMPKARRAWASWNVRLDECPSEQGPGCQISYWMNNLQNIKSDTQFIVSLNMQDRIDKSTILAERHYSHPVYTPGAVVAQQRHADINGDNNTFFVGAYWGWGFHEDGVKSALKTVKLILGDQNLAARQHKTIHEAP